MRRFIDDSDFSACSFRRAAAYGLLVAVGVLFLQLPMAAAQEARHIDTTKRLPRVALNIVKDAADYATEPGAKVYTDDPATIESLATELVGLGGIAFPKDGHPILDTRADIEIVVGYFKGDGGEFAKPPAGLTPVIQNAAKISGMPDVDVYFVRFGKTGGKDGKEIDLGPGKFVIFGAVPAEWRVTPRDAHGGEVKG